MKTGEKVTRGGLEAMMNSLKRRYFAYANKILKHVAVSEKERREIDSYLVLFKESYLDQVID
jgi:hypothetical protein